MSDSRESFSSIHSKLSELGHSSYQIPVDYESGTTTTHGLSNQPHLSPEFIRGVSLITRFFHESGHISDIFVNCVHQRRNGGLQAEATHQTIPSDTGKINSQKYKLANQELAIETTLKAIELVLENQVS